jgi:hypothetical protein
MESCGASSSQTPGGLSLLNCDFTNRNVSAHHDSTHNGSDGSITGLNPTHPDAAPDRGQAADSRDGRPVGRLRRVAFRLIRSNALGLFPTSATHLTYSGGRNAILMPETGQVKKNPGPDIAPLLWITAPNHHNGASN